MASEFPAWTLLGHFSGSGNDHRLQFHLSAESFPAKQRLKKAPLRRGAPESGNAHRHRWTGHEGGAGDRRSFYTASVAPALLPPPLRGRRQLRPLIPQPYSQHVRRFSSAAPSSLVSPHDHRFDCRWRYLWQPGVPLPPGRGGGAQKKGLFSSAKKPPRRQVPATIPKPGGSGGSFLRGGLSRPR
jgi:hypothetical protein